MRPSFEEMRASVLCAFLWVLLATTWLGSGAKINGQPLKIGDVLASTSSGRVLVYSPSGTLKQTLETGRAGDLTGSAFDSKGNLYVSAGFAGGGVVKFDSKLDFKGDFGSGYQDLPESVLVDAAGNIFVGAARNGSGQAAIKKFSPNGTPLTTYFVERESRGSDWIDLAANQKTIYYTSEGSQVKRYDISTQTQLSDFSSAGREFYAFRLLGDGGLLAANSNNVLRLNGSGNVSKTYLEGSRILFALNLDPDKTSFWTAEMSNGNIYKVDIASGSVLTTIQAGTSIKGLAVYGEITASFTPPPPPPPPPPTGFISFGVPLPCNFGTLRSNSQGSSTLDLSPSNLTGYVDLELRSGFHDAGAALEIDTGSGWQKLGANVVHLRADAQGSRNWPVRLRIADCPGALKASSTQYIDVFWRAPEGRMEQLRVPVHAEIVPDSWLHCWWPVLLLIGAILVGIFIFYGYWSPARFAPRVGVMLAPEPDIDQEGFFHPIRGQPGSGAGFYRDAMVYICQDFRISGKASNALVELRAGRSQIRLRPVAAVWRRNAEGEWEEILHDVYVRAGVLHRNDSSTLFFEIRNR